MAMVVPARKKKYQAEEMCSLYSIDNHVLFSCVLADRAYFVTFHLAREAEQQGRNDVSVLPDFDRIPIDKHNMFKVNESLARHKRLPLCISCLRVRLNSAQNPCVRQQVWRTH